jgi:Ca-activated chloride channel family protein
MIRRFALFLSAALLLSACSKPDESPSSPAAPQNEASTLQVLATSDLRDVEPLAAQIEAATGVRVKFRFGGTMESTQEVLDGGSGPGAADAAWFANAKYLLSDANGQRRVKMQEKIMLGRHHPRSQRRQAELRALQPGHQQPRLHGPAGRGSGGRWQGRGPERR